MLTYPICHFSDTEEDNIVAFKFTINTANISAGSSASNQMMLPLESSGTYNFNINWGDSSNNDGITTWNQAETTHTYAASGIYTVTITGQCHGWRFANTGDRLKILDVISTGNTGDSNGFRLGNNNGYFRGCANLEWSATDAIDLTGTARLDAMFQFCTNFNGAIGNWDVSNVTHTFAMFMFTGFNQPINNWDMSSVIVMGLMFRDAASFDQPLDNWDVSSAINMNNMFQNITLSTVNYSQYVNCMEYVKFTKQCSIWRWEFAVFSRSSSGRSG